MSKYSVKGYTKPQKPIAKIKPGEQVIGGDSSLINPKKTVKKKSKSLFQKIFG